MTIPEFRGFAGVRPVVLASTLGGWVALDPPLLLFGRVLKPIF